MNLTFPIRSDKLSMSVHATRHLADVKTDFQKIDVYDTEVFGRVLMLDGHIQLTTFDERAYHESLVHVCMLNVSEPKKALVVGGGDGGVLRELCRYSSLTQIDMVEIDVEVVNVSKQYLPEVSGGAFDDPRVNLYIADAFEFVRSSTDTYDLIVVDCTDVYEEEEGELSERLFTDEFYRDVHARLSPGGFAVTQADNLVFCPYSLEEISEMFRRVFEKVGTYWAVVPSFGGFSGFCWGSKGPVIAENPPQNRFVEGLTVLDALQYRLALSPCKW